MAAASFAMKEVAFAVCLGRIHDLDVEFLPALG
jgi:hypothetical protein